MEPAYQYEEELSEPIELSEIERRYRIEQTKKRIWNKQFNKGWHNKSIYTDPIDLQIMVDEYFKNGIKERTIIVGSGANTRETKVKMPTITGLMNYLGFENRSSFYDMEKIPCMTHTIKKTRQLIEEHYETYLMSSNTVGSIFALKNLSWVDKTEQTINQTIREVKVTINDPNTANIVNEI